MKTNETIKTLMNLNTLDGTINPKHLVEKFNDDIELIRVPFLIAWFRTIFPNGGIIPETVWKPEIKAWVSTVIITTNDGKVLAKGSAAAGYDETTEYGKKPMETAETAAIGRALRHAGFGVLYSVNEDVKNPGAGSEQAQVEEMSVSEFEDAVNKLSCSINGTMAKGVSMTYGPYKGKTIKEIYQAEEDEDKLRTIRKYAYPDTPNKHIEQVAAARAFIAAFESANTQE